MKALNLTQQKLTKIRNIIMTEFIEHIMDMFKIACYLCAAGGMLTLIYQGFQGQFNRMIFFATVAAAFLPGLLQWLAKAAKLNVEGML